MNNLKSYTEYAVTTPTTDFVIGFDFNYGTDAVNVTVDGVPASVAGYSVIYLNSTTMRLNPAVPSGVVRLQRETDIDVPDNQFTAGAKFIASNMDENFTQIRHAQQEVRDGFEKLSEDTYEIIDTLQDVGQAAQDAADAAEQAAQTANDAAAQVNDKVSYQDLDNAIAATPHNNFTGRDVVGAHTASAILDVGGNTQQEVNNNQAALNTETVYVDWVLPGVKLSGDWDGTTGTDDTAKLQQIIDSFGVKRINLLFGEKRYRLDSARIDFKRVNLIGKGTTDNGATGGTEFYIGNLGGFYSSIEDNQAPRQENIRITSSSERTQNGQTALDLTGLNYPNMSNVLIYGSENPLVLSGGTVVESHYGRFDNVSVSRGYNGVVVNGGNRSQTHNFFGGRLWDCVTGCLNNGTADINFHGTAFESDRAYIATTRDGTNPEVNIFGMRDECDFAPTNDATDSTMTYVGAYWSGWKKPREFSIAAGDVVEKGKILTANVRGDMSILGHNLLRNPDLKTDLSTNRPIGWTFPSSATDVAEVSLPRGRGWKWTRGATFQAFEQNGINLKKGRYMIGFTVDKFNSETSGAIILQLLNSGGTVLTAGVDVNVDFNSTNFTSISGAHLGSQVVREIVVLQDLTNVRFRAGINNMPAGQVGFFGQPFIVKGANFDKFYNTKDYAEDVQYSTAAPTSVSHRAGQVVINPYPTSTNPVTEWIADTTTTWKPVKWVINNFPTASLPTLTPVYRGVEVFDTTTNTFKRWTGTGWI